MGGQDGADRAELVRWAGKPSVKIPDLKSRA